MPVREKTQQVVDRVNELLTEGRTKREAFQLVADEMGGKASSVATSFYRVARAQGGGAAASGGAGRAGGARGRGSSARARRGAGGSGGSRSGPSSAINGDTIAEYIRRLERENEELRERERTLLSLYGR